VPVVFVTENEDVLALTCKPGLLTLELMLKHNLTAWWLSHCTSAL